MKTKILIIVGIIAVMTLVFFQACKEDTLPEVLGNSKIELTIRLDSTSYVFAELLCELSDFPTFKVEKYGFCWDTIAKVTVEKTLNQFENLSNQNFTNTINNLLPNKEYYVKGYIQSGAVVIYSNEISLNTLDARPAVSTADIDKITGISAQGGGIADAYEELFPITQRGVCWAKTENPTIKNNLTNDEGGVGAFTSVLNDLDAGSTYYVRAYAINSAGESYGEVKNFKTLDGIPEITTDSIGNVTATSATLYGNIIDNDGLSILEKGFCWNTTSSPTIESNKLDVAGNDLGTFRANLSNLELNTSYYVRAYIINEVDTYYGDEISFTTRNGLPILTTNTISNITAISAVGGGSITDDGGFAVTSRGICWSISPNPTTEDSKTIDGPGLGDFTNNLTSLDVNTNYYVRAYATNSAGESYGVVKSFKTLDGIPEFTTDSIRSVTATSATLYGNIIDNGGLEILEKGFCWNTSTNPTLENNFQIVAGNSLGSYNSSITNFTVYTTYYVKTFVKNIYGTFYGNQQYFTTGYAPISDFSANKTDVSVNELISFTDQSANNPTSWAWDFGDGNISTQQNPSHSYTTSGLYNVTLTANNSYGSNTEVKTNYITVGSTPVIAFSANKTDVSVNESISFTDQSANNPTSWVWDFGDGNTSIQQNPSHSYTTTGLYNVTLTATNSYGSNTEVKTNYITVGSTPVIAFSANKTDVSVNESISFTDQSANNPTSWAWDFGDGNTSTQQNPSHSYTTSGLYNVTLTATNNYGSNTETKVNYITVGSAPIVAFSASKTDVDVNESISFTDQSTNNPTSWAWDFGDGITSTQQNPSHSYTSQGTYSVSLTATNSYGSNSQTRANYITVNETSGTFVDTRDGQTYNWIKIGNDIWMAENLNYSMSGAIGVSPTSVYGWLYSYDAAVNACPAGWSLPSRGDRDRLIENLGGSNVAGGKMKTIGTSYWNSPNTGATNESGFSALPAGAYTSTIIERGQYANFWVNYVYSDGTASYFHMSYNNESVYNHAYEKNTMISVRCVKD